MLRDVFSSAMLMAPASATIFILGYSRAESAEFPLERSSSSLALSSKDLVTCVAFVPDNANANKANYLYFIIKLYKNIINGIL